EPHRVDEAAVSPARPVTAAIGFEQYDPRLRLEPVQMPRGPHPRVAAPDHEHVGVDRAFGDRQGLYLPRFLEPIAVSGVPHPVGIYAFAPNMWDWHAHRG